MKTRGILSGRARTVDLSRLALAACRIERSGRCAGRLWFVRFAQPRVATPTLPFAARAKSVVPCSTSDTFVEQSIQRHVFHVSLRTIVTRREQPVVDLCRHR
jgi:hypothetical protein